MTGSSGLGQTRLQAASALVFQARPGKAFGCPSPAGLLPLPTPEMPATFDSLRLHV